MKSADVLSERTPLQVQHSISEHGGNSQSAIIGADFAARQLDGSHPFVVERSASFHGEVGNLIPSTLTVVRIAYSSSGGCTILARNKKASALVKWGSAAARVTVAATSLRHANRVLDAIIGRLPAPPSDEKLRVDIWHRSDSGPRNRTVRIDAHLWSDIEVNYPSQVQAALTHLIALEKPQGGKLILWHGAPGTGKTTAIRALAKEWESWCRTSYVADPERLFADTGYLVDVVTERVIGRDGTRDQRWQLVVAEDSDEYLRTTARREAGAALGRLLNITDGILGHGSNTLVLLTTNERIDRLHPALTRPGRSLANIEFEAFDAKDAAQWLPAGVAPPHGAATLAELYELSGAGHRITNKEAETEAFGTYL